MKRIKILGLLIPFLVLIFPLFSFARDTEIYMASGEGVEPNILIIFDNSSSMNDVMYYQTYNPGTTYDEDEVPTEIGIRFINGVECMGFIWSR